MQKPLLKTAMQPFPFTVEAKAELPEATRLMNEHDIRHLPVTEGGRMVGILSDRDIRLAESLSRHVGEHQALTVGEVCTRNPYVVDINTPLSSVLAEMTARHISSALVTKNEKLVGIFTSTDVCRIFADHLKRQFGITPSEPDIA